MSGPCTECGRVAGRLRRGRCNACYMRLYRGGEVPAGQSCAGCGERRRHVLARSELAGVDLVLCGNCARVLERARPQPASLEELRRRVERERRLLPDRRTWPPVPHEPERRVGPRRAVERRPQAPVLDMGTD